MYSMETWLPVPGYEGKYDVSDLGNLRRIHKHDQRRKRTLPPRLVKPVRCKMTGYMKVTLSAHNAQKTFSVHRLVVAAFLPQTIAYTEVNHKDGDRTNNQLSNLEWMTRSANIRDGFTRNVGRLRGSNNNNAKLDEAAVLDIRANCAPRIPANRKAMCAKYGVGMQTISFVVNRIIWKHV